MILSQQLSQKQKKLDDAWLVCDSLACDGLVSFTRYISIYYVYCRGILI